MNSKIFCTPLLLLILISPAFAHDTTLVYSTLNMTPPDAHITMNIPQANFKLLYPNKTLDQAIAVFPEYVKSNLRIGDETGGCPAGIDSKKEAETVRVSATYHCASLDVMNLSYSMFFDISSTHENVLDMSIPEANISGQVVLSEQGIYNVNIPVARIIRDRKASNLSANQSAVQANITNATSAGFGQEKNTIAQFFVLGVEHIFTGYDHILFIIGILLITTFFLQLTKIVTSFTIAHSITLIIATLGIFALSPRLTEPLIALTIVYIAAENIYFLRREKRKKGPGTRKSGHRYILQKYFGDPAKRWRITCFLGLVHGFGFSSVLKDIGLPKGDVIPALLSFNLGVEAGQLAIVAVLFPLLIYSRRFRWHNKAVLWLSVFIGLVGAFWFLQRVFF